MFDTGTLLVEWRRAEYSQGKFLVFCNLDESQLSQAYMPNNYSSLLYF